MPRAAPSLSDKVPWRTLLREDAHDPTSPQSLVLCADDHALTRVYGIEGLDYIGDEPETIGVHMLQANQALKRVVGPWTLHAEAQRRRFTAYPERAARFVVADLVDADRRQALTGPNGKWETNYFLSLTWVPPQGHKNIRTQFRLAADDFMQHLGVALAAVRPLADTELTTCLKTTVSLRWTPVDVPLPRTNLARYLCDSAWHAGRYPAWDATLGTQHIRVLTLTGYPRQSTALMMQRLDTLGLPFRWSVRWGGILPHKQDAILYELQKDFLAEEKTLMQRTVERSSGQQTRLTKEYAVRMTEDMSTARQDTSAGIYGIGESSTVLFTWGRTADEANTRAQQIRHTLEGLGFVVRHEAEYGARSRMAQWFLQLFAPPHHTAMFLGAMPGNRTDGRRRAITSTLQLSHLLPGLRTLWSGPTRDEHLNSGPWFLAQTEQHSVVRLTHFVHGVGHALYLGNTGSGKSTTLGFQMLQWLMYPTTRGRILDVGRSHRLMTLLVGGEVIDCSVPRLLQPLRSLEHSAVFTWCHDWLSRVCERANVEEKGGVVRQYLHERLAELRQYPHATRTISRLLELCERHLSRVEPNAYKRRDRDGLSRPDDRILEIHERYRAVQRALRALVGTVLDGVQERIADAHLVTYEQGTLAKTPRVLEAVSQYLFHEIETSLDTRQPTWIIAEEAPLLATMPQYRETFDLWLMTLRKEGGSLALVINSLEQAKRLGVGLLTNENTPTRWYFPNKDALVPATREVYELFGLTRAEIQVIATMTPQSDVYYVCRERGRRRLQLPLSRFIVDCVGRNSDADHEVIDRLLEKHGREEFAAAWCEHHHYLEAAEAVRKGGMAYAMPVSAAETVPG